MQFLGLFLLKKSGTVLNRIQNSINFLQVINNSLSKMSSQSNNQFYKRKYKVAICQLTCKEDINENFKVAKDLILKAKREGAEVKQIIFVISLNEEFNRK